MKMSEVKCGLCVDGVEGDGLVGGLDVLVVVSTVRGSRRYFYFEPERGIREWTGLRESGKEVSTRNASHQADSGNNQSFCEVWGNFC